MDEVELVAVGKEEPVNIQTLEAMALTAFMWGNTNTVKFDDRNSELMHYQHQRTNDKTDRAKVTLPNGTVIQATEV